MKFAFFNTLFNTLHAHSTNDMSNADDTCSIFNNTYDTTRDHSIKSTTNIYSTNNAAFYNAPFYSSDKEDSCPENIPTIADGNTYLECIYDSSLPFTQESWCNLVDLAAQLQDDPIMDVLYGWEMEDGAWLSDSPLVLRFELQDVILQPTEDGSLRIWHGILDDESDCLLEASWLPNGAHLSDTQRSRMHRERCRIGAGVSQACWIPYPPLYDIIGAYTTASDWLAVAQRIHRNNHPTVADCVQALMVSAA